jgi:hypothetical protein
MINIFCGYDEREAVGFHVFCHSVITRASRPVRITPLASHGLPQGSNTFTLSRFLVPHLMGFKGHAVFADACDMLMLGDLAELDALFEPGFAVQVVKHPEYTSQHDRKYVGTEMECAQTNYARKNWASLMIINCEHPYWKVLDLPTLRGRSILSLLQFGGLSLKKGNEEVGALPPEWNVLIDEGQPREGAKLLHWTAGLPTFRHYKNARGSADWFAGFDSMNKAMQHG